MFKRLTMFFDVIELLMVGNIIGGVVNDIGVGVVDVAFIVVCEVGLGGFLIGILNYCIGMVVEVGGVEFCDYDRVIINVVGVGRVELGPI